MGKPDLSGGGSGGSPDSHRNLGGRPIRPGGLCCRMKILVLFKNVWSEKE